MITGRYGDRVGRIRNLDEERNETYDGKTPFEWKDGKMNYLGRDPNFESNTYYRGGSRPRLNADGSFTGINVANDNLDFENDFEGAAKRFGSIADHENVHQLIEGEIDGWAREQAGLDTARERATAKKEEMRSEREESDEDKIWGFLDDEKPPEKTRRRRWSRNSNPILDADFQSTPEAEELKDAERRADHLGSMGHESGAYSLDGGGKKGEGRSLAEIREFLARRQSVYPAGAYSDKLSELHTAGPSEDQLRYEQLLQQQEAKQ